MTAHAAAPPAPPPTDSGGASRPPRAPRPKLKKLRLLLILGGLGVLAMVSTVFGMMMAVASDLPDLENKAEYRRAENSVVYTEATAGGGDSQELAKLTGNQNRILIDSSEISPYIKNAVIAIEDRRYYDHDGVDYKGIARALVQDIRQQSAVQGGSTITQQFVKNALAAQGDRSVFQKLREAALAYHLERKWSKEKVLEQYLNSVYFGSGAYGVEAAARTYFGYTVGDDEPQSGGVSPSEAALLAGMIASPSMYDPVQNPTRAKQRRDDVLIRMRDQGFLTEAEYQDALDDALPSEQEVDPPAPESDQPYFTSWLTQQLVDRYQAPAVFSGGLEVTTTLDPELQAAAENAIEGRIGGVGPSSSLVTIENDTGEVKAMVGGTDFEGTPFNLATYGHRQPGSAFKPFTLVRALEDGVSPDATFSSQQKEFPVPNSRGEVFEVNNYEDSYSGVASLDSATATSDNSVYAELGLDVGTERIADLAQEMGINTEISTNPAMTLGGLEQGVTPLELAYAFSTIANEGRRVSGSLAADPGGGPVAIQSVKGAGREEENERRAERVFSKEVGQTAKGLLEGVVTGGTGTSAQIGEFAAGKTGTTENYGDAWFCGFNAELTTCVWVGYPDKLTPMLTEYAGGPVAGGTYPAEIWGDLMRQWIAIREARGIESGGDEQEAAPVPLETEPIVPEAPVEEVPVTPAAEPVPVEPAPAPEPVPQPAPVPAPPPAAVPPSGGVETEGGGAAPE
jgi:penicillin-binding protein 1A